MASLEELAAEESAPKGNRLEDLAAAEATPPGEGELRAPTPAPEQSFWQKAKAALTPDDSTVPSRLMATQNGATGGLAPKINALGEKALRTVGHGLAPETIDDPPWKDVLAKNQRLYGASSALHPVLDVAGSMAIPVPGAAGGLAARVGKMGAASGLQAATRAYGESPDEGVKALQGKAPEITLSALLGGGLGAGSYVVSKLTGKGEQIASNAVAKNAQQVADEAEKARRSAGRAVGVESTAAHTVLANARDAAANPNLSPEAIQKAKDFLASEYARSLGDRANSLNLERGQSLESALGRASDARDAVTEKYSPEGIAAIEDEKLQRPEMGRRIWDLAKKNAPGAVGAGLGYLVGHDPLSTGIGGALGGVIGSVSGKPGTILRNGIRTPAFQKALGDFMSTAGSTAEGAATSPAAMRSAAGGGSLAEYLDLLKQKDEP